MRWAGPVKAAIDVPTPSLISEVNHTRVESIHLPWPLQSAISPHTFSIGALHSTRIESVFFELLAMKLRIGDIVSTCRLNHIWPMATELPLSLA
jgi:hypothetical protein